MDVEFGWGVGGVKYQPLKQVKPHSGAAAPECGFVSIVNNTPQRRDIWPKRYGFAGLREHVYQW